MSVPFALERFIAELTVQRAAILSQTVLTSLTNQTIRKADKSPVTLADFGSQALIISAIHRNFPNDKIMGEENAAALRADPGLRDRVWELVSKTRLDDKQSEELLGTMGSAVETLDAIDLGSATDGREGRVWILDPVDGTKGFLKGLPYAVSLALLVDGEQKVGVVGCPNLSPSNPFGDVPANTPEKQPAGALISATRGQGSTIRTLSYGALSPPLPLPRNPPNAIPMRIVDILESTSSNIPKHAAVASHLSASWPDSSSYAIQLEYIALALGAADAFIRIPADKDKRDCIWDHAGGALIAEEVGVKITDVWGAKIDFGRGRKLWGNWGFVAAAEGLHGKILEVVGKVAREE
ncbi:MAG: hypothetical protein M1839_003504 [Geoglossum umbratile]|nr:MAG: hypothetical protein M1839_003504 [Geoglossum umbratile]